MSEWNDSNAPRANALQGREAPGGFMRWLCAWTACLFGYACFMWHVAEQTHGKAGVPASLNRDLHGFGVAVVASLVLARVPGLFAAPWMQHGAFTVLLVLANAALWLLCAFLLFATATVGMSFYC